MTTPSKPPFLTNFYWRLWFWFKIYNCLVFGLLYFTPQAHAQIIITEVFPVPSSGSEWVEIYNNSDQAIDITNWQLEDKLSSPSSIHTFTGSITANSFLVAELASSKLNNSADGVILKNSTGTVVDQFNYTSSQSDLSWSRSSILTDAFGISSPTKGYSNSDVFFSVNPTPTPSPSPSPFISPSPTPSPSPSSQNISTVSLSEFSPCPESGGEWIELFNSSDQLITLTNWQIKDADGNSSLINGSLNANSFTVFSWSKSLLNNAGDSFTVISNTGLELATATYTDCLKNYSFIYQDTSWILTDQPTPGTSNPHLSTLETVTDLPITTTTINSPTPSPSPSPAPPVALAPSQKSRSQFPIPDLTLLTATPPASVSRFISIPPPQPYKYGLLSVIIGGLTLTGASAIQIYYAEKKSADAKFDPFP